MIKSRCGKEPKVEPTKKGLGELLGKVGARLIHGLKSWLVPPKYKMVWVQKKVNIM